MFNQFSLKTKMFAMSLSLAFMAALVGVVGYYFSSETSKSYSFVANTVLPNVRLVGRLDSDFMELRMINRSLGLPGLPPEQVTRLLGRIKDVQELFDKNSTEYEGVPFQPGEQEVYTPVQNVAKKFREFTKTVVSLAQSKSPDDKQRLQDLLLKDGGELGAEWDKSIEGLIDFHKKIAEKSVNQAASADHMGVVATVTTTAIALCLACLVGYFFSQSLSQTLSQLADSIAAGATAVASASTQISESGAELSASTTEQAAALQETVSSIDQVSAMVSKSADNARRSLEVANSSQQAAIQGKQAVDQMLVAIDNISRSNSELTQQTERSNQEIASIVKVITEIGNKTKVINDIVFQTKLLSFNASVEAARAGEHGKGFAVVAEEVGNLAQMSGNAAKEISQMLDDSVRKVEGIVTETKSQVERLVRSGKDTIESGANTARRCGDSLEDIVKNVSELNQMVSEISKACQEQSQGVQEITKAMGQMDQVTQQNAASSQQSARASDDLNTQAASLHHLVDSLVQTIQGAGASAGAVQPREAAAKKTAVAGPTARVLPIKRKETYIPHKGISQMASTGARKMAVGTTAELPSEDDPRFEDV